MEIGIRATYGRVWKPEFPKTMLEKGAFLRPGSFGKVHRIVEVFPDPTDDGRIPTPPAKQY